MRLLILGLATFSLLTAACAESLPAPSVAGEPAAPSRDALDVEKPVLGKPHHLKWAKSDGTHVAKNDTTPSAIRKLGDFHVYQYSGAFAKQPITLTEQVVAQEDDVLVVDFVLDEAGKTSALRVRMRGDNDVVRVAKMTDDGEIPATRDDYDALMQRTAFVPDRNDDIVGIEHTSCLVGDEQVDCDVTTYKVTIADHPAKLAITRSAKVPGRDIGGDVVAEDGTVLYSARLVERGNEAPVVESLARLDRLPSERR
jgi:hypothetical protein